MTVPSRSSLLSFATHRRSAFRMAAFPSMQPYALRRASLSRLAFENCVPAVLPRPGAGISTRSPSATRLRLALGPDLPRADQLYPGNLGYSAKRIPTSFSLLIPAFSLPASPPSLSVRLLRSRDCSSTDRIYCDPRASVACFSPGHFRRRTSRPVSYYALFQCVAASEPTSWLSGKSLILFHLTRTPGP